MAISNLYFNEDWLWESRKKWAGDVGNGGTRKTVWRGLRGLVHGEVDEVRGVQLETPGM